jgi:GAF domain-containing protein
MVDQQRLAQTLLQFTANLVTHYEVADILDQLCDRAVEILPVSGAGVMLEDRQGHLRFVSASDETVRSIESLQIELNEGPCLHAYRTGEQVVVTDLEHSDRFPRFTPLALQKGLRAVYSFPMKVGDEHIGAVNLYREEPGRFDDDDAAAGQVLADVATTYIMNARLIERSTQLNEQLQHALNSRVVIEQAKGKLSEQLGVDPPEAFARMRGYARNRGLKLLSVAEEIVSGSLRLEEE